MTAPFSSRHLPARAPLFYTQPAGQDRARSLRLHLALRLHRAGEPGAEASTSPLQHALCAAAPPTPPPPPTPAALLQVANKRSNHGIGVATDGGGAGQHPPEAAADPARA
jgi:hypothetical protein